MVKKREKEANQEKLGLIAVAADGKTLESKVDSRFGRCPFFLIVDQEGKLLRVLENKATAYARGAGVSAAQIIVNEEVGQVIAGNFGPKALALLTPSGVKAYSSQGQTVKDALADLRKGKLSQTDHSPGFRQRGGGFGCRG